MDPSVRTTHGDEHGLCDPSFHDITQRPDYNESIENIGRPAFVDSTKECEIPSTRPGLGSPFSSTERTLGGRMSSSFAPILPTSNIIKGENVGRNIMQGR